MFWIPKQPSRGAHKYLKAFQLVLGKSLARQRLPASTTATL